MLYHHIIQCPSIIICQVVVYSWRLKTKENFKLLALKVIAVAYKGFQLQWFSSETVGIM